MFEHFSDQIIYGKLDAFKEYQKDSFRFHNFPWTNLILKRPHHKKVSSANIIFLYQADFISHKALFCKDIKWTIDNLYHPNLPFVPRMTELAFTHEEIFTERILRGQQAILAKHLLAHKHKFYFYRLCQLYQLFSHVLPNRKWKELFETYEENDGLLDHDILYRKSEVFKHLLYDCTLKRRMMLLKEFSKNAKDFIPLLEKYHVLNYYEHFRIKKKFKNFQDLYQYIFKKHQFLKQGNFSFPQKYKLYKDKYLEIRVPKNHDELIDWSFKMENCLAKFSTAILHEKTAIFGVFIQNELKFVAEIKNKDLLKIEAARNCPMVPSYVVQALEKQVLLTKESFSSIIKCE